MASSMLPKSLQRTDSTGQLNVFILLKKKSNNGLLIVSREDLPPTLRSGRLVLNQKIIIRDEERNSIEGVIVYMNADRLNCVAYKEQMTEHKTQHTNKLSGDAGSSDSGSSAPSSSHTGVRSALPKGNSKTTSVPPLRSTPKTPKTPSANKQSVKSPPKPSYEGESQRNYDNTDYNTTNDVCDFSFSPTTNINEKNKLQSTLDDTFDASVTITDDHENDIFIDKINQLSVRLNKQAQLIKDRDIELKRLRATTIDLPTDQITRDYICCFADKIRQSTTGFKYAGNLTKDAKCLGIDVIQLKEILSLKNGITSVAREIFKRIIPENKRSVNHWNELSEAVILKEKILIKFLEQYYGPLEVEPKKVHTSLVGCLRNDRGKQKTLKQQAELILDNDKDYNHLEPVNDGADEDD